MDELGNSKPSQAQGAHAAQATTAAAADTPVRIGAASEREAAAVPTTAAGRTVFSAFMKALNPNGVSEAERQASWAGQGAGEAQARLGSSSEDLGSLLRSAGKRAAAEGQPAEQASSRRHR